MPNTPKRLGDLLISKGIITELQLHEALEHQAKSPKTLGATLLELGMVDEHVLLRALASQRGVQPWLLDQEPASPQALQLVGPDLCRRYQIVPVKVLGDRLILAMRNPSDIDAIDLVRNLTGLRIESVMVSERILLEVIDRINPIANVAPTKAKDSDSVDKFVNQAMTEYGTSSHRRSEKLSEITEEDIRPVVGLVNQIIQDSIERKASDVHFEPRADRIDIRYRLDGQLVKVREIPISLAPMLIARIKIMAELNIVEYRIPQDGRMSVEFAGREVDIRVNVLPNYHGQRIALRVLDSRSAVNTLDEVGFNATNRAIFSEMITKPYGMVLVTGPTGCGKTTTLYAGLNEIKSESTNIMTCEDPVEYDLEGINQSQVNEKVGLTFATQLRSILRQDPDAVLIGEIRDKETAETAIRAALTGHLVLSTLHCNDAPSAIPRLLDIGIDPYILSTSMIGVISQRLLRILCPSCKEAIKPSDSDLQVMEALGYSGSKQVWRAVGCSECNGTGYRGRMAVHEIMPVPEEVANLVAKRYPVEAIRNVAADFGFRTMQEDALDRVLAGQTTLQEARRLLFYNTFAHREVVERPADEVSLKLAS